MTRAVLEALMDKAEAVRKAALGLVVKLVLTHPYGLMHGGLLDMREWRSDVRALGRSGKGLQGRII
jgi:condensin complex subunit 1